MKEKKGAKTMLMSILMSAPGPLILGAGLLLGKSNTQIADFVRRSIELLALVVSYAAYRMTAGQEEDRQRRTERGANLFVGATMLAAGLIMLGIALFSGDAEQGSGIVGLIVALLGAVANTIFWLRYKKLAKAEGSAILEVQSRLYRAKSLVDICVTAALLALLIAPASAAAFYMDRMGTAVVSAYLGYSGAKIVAERLRKPIAI